jgi:hypothetical protein
VSALPLKAAAALALAAMLVAAGPVKAAAPADVYSRIVDAKVAYAADVVMSNGRVTVKGRIMHTPGATRTQLGRMVTVLDLKRERMFQFLPGQSRYLELPTRGDAKAVYLPPGLMRGQLRSEALGEETVGGERVRKIKLSFPTGALTLWQTRDGIVVKMVGAAKVHGRNQDVTMALKNLKRGPQDPALFAPPKGAKRLNAPLPKKKR